MTVTIAEHARWTMHPTPSGFVDSIHGSSTYCRSAHSVGVLKTPNFPWHSVWTWYVPGVPCAGAETEIIKGNVMFPSASRPHVGDALTDPNMTLHFPRSPPKNAGWE